MTKEDEEKIFNVAKACAESAKKIMNQFVYSIGSPRACKSVSDQDTKDAIRLLEWCKAQAEKNDPIASGDEIAEATKRYDLAISALKAYRSQEPCEWCDTENKERMRTEGVVRSHLFFGNPQYKNFAVPVSMNYCPNCGRKLVEDI